MRTYTINATGPGAMRRMAAHLRSLAQQIEDGAPILHGGLLANNERHLSGDITLGEVPQSRPRGIFVPGVMSKEQAEALSRRIEAVTARMTGERDPYYLHGARNTVGEDHPYDSMGARLPHRVIVQPPHRKAAKLQHKTRVAIAAGRKAERMAGAGAFYADPLWNHWYKVLRRLAEYR